MYELSNSCFSSPFVFFFLVILGCLSEQVLSLLGSLLGGVWKSSASANTNPAAHRQCTCAEEKLCVAGRVDLIRCFIRWGESIPVAAGSSSSRHRNRDRIIFKCCREVDEKKTSELKISAVNIQSLMRVKSLRFGLETSCDGKLKHALHVGTFSSRITSCQSVENDSFWANQSSRYLTSSFLFCFCLFCFLSALAKLDCNLTRVLERGSNDKNVFPHRAQQDRKPGGSSASVTLVATSVKSTFSPHRLGAVPATVSRKISSNQI